VPAAVRTHSVLAAPYFAPSNAKVHPASWHSCEKADALHDTSAPSRPIARTWVAWAAGSAAAE
jgi:hypothetical protein